ncbi:hypothetical protein ACHQM5_020152 [Ranunculus cassubicifolius]
MEGLIPAVYRAIVRNKRGGGGSMIRKQRRSKSSSSTYIRLGGSNNQLVLHSSSSSSYMTRASSKTRSPLSLVACFHGGHGVANTRDGNQ